MTMSRPLPQRSQEVAQKLERAILAGDYAVGSRLPSEEKLGKQFKASRTVIREAIQQLNSRGLVTTRVGSGSYVTAYNPDNLRNALNYYSVLNAGPESYRELFDLRFLIETECVRRLTLSRDERGLARVWEQLERMHRNFTNNEIFAEADIAFHLTAVDVVGNHLFSALMSALQPLMLRYAKETQARAEHAGLNEKTWAEHRDIFEAIRSGNEVKAVTTLRRHLQGSLVQFDSQSR